MGITLRGQSARGTTHDNSHARAWQAVRQITLVLLLTLAYFLTRGLIRGRASVAFQHAREILSIERALHLDPEAALQHFALAHSWLMDAANFFYIFGHLPVLISVAVWLFWTRPAAYRWFRNAFLISAGIGLSIYAIFPVAPPRYLPGFTDTLKVGGINLDGSSIALFYNPYAAMPSLHVGWALLAAVVVVRSARAWWLRVGGALLPVVMTFTVLMTANHFLLDIVAGCTIAVVALIASAWWIRHHAVREVTYSAASPVMSSPTGPTPFAAPPEPVAVPVGAPTARGLVQARRHRARRTLRQARKVVCPL